MPATARAFKLCLREVEEKELSLKTYTAALDYIPAVFEHLGSVFSFAKKDLDEKISLLQGRASESDLTLKGAIHADFENDKAYAGCSNSRTLHRVTNAVKFVHLLLKDMLREESKKEHLRVSAKRAYQGSIEYYLAWPVKRAIALGLYMLPSRQKFLKSIGEDEDSARVLAAHLVADLDPILTFVYGIYTDLGIDL